MPDGRLPVRRASRSRPPSRGSRCDAARASRLRSAARGRAARPFADADVVVGIGGFASAPAALAARRCAAPARADRAEHACPAWSNRIAARWAAVVATPFEATAARLPAGTRVERDGQSDPRRDRRGGATRTALRARRGPRSTWTRTARRCWSSAGARERCTSTRRSPGASARSATAPICSCWCARAPRTSSVVRAAIDPDAAAASCVPCRSSSAWICALAVADLAVARAGRERRRARRLRDPVDPRPVPVRDREPPGGERARTGGAGAAEIAARRRDLTPTALAAAHPGTGGRPTGVVADGGGGAAWARPDAADGSRRWLGADGGDG